MSAGRLLHVVASDTPLPAPPVTRLRRFSVPDHLTCRRKPGCVFSPDHEGTCLPRPRPSGQWTSAAAPVTR